MERSPIVQTRVRSSRDLKAFAGADSTAGSDRLRPRRAAVVGALSALVLGVGVPAFAQSLPAVSVGVGLRTSFAHTQLKNDDIDTTDESFDNFTLNDARLYVNGSVTKNIKLTFNTDYNSSTNA